MKIIGATEDGFILEASRDDVAALEGLYSHQKKFKVGDLIDIYGLFRQYKTIRMALDDIHRLKQSAQNIMNSADWVEEFREGKENFY